MRTLVAVVGWTFIAFSLIFVAVEFDDHAQQKTKNANVGIALIIACAGGGALMVRASRRMGRPDDSSRTTIIIRAAQKRGGRITAAEVVTDTSLSFEEAKIELERLGKAGACEVVVGDAGILVYRFPEFENPANKTDVV